MIRRWFPVLYVNAQQARAIRNLVRQRDRLEADLLIQERRAQRWRRAALELGPKVGPRAMDVLLMQVQSEEIEDLPEMRGTR